MDGGKKRHGQRWSSVVALKKLWVLTLVKRIVLLCFSKNGMHTAMVFLNTAKENPGTASSTKASICSKHLHGIIAYGFAVRRRIYNQNASGTAEWNRIRLNTLPRLISMSTFETSLR